MAFEDELVKLQRSRAFYLDYSHVNNPGGFDWPDPLIRLYGKAPDARGPIPIKGTVMSFGTFARAVCNREYDLEFPSAVVELVDFENEWRTLAATPQLLLYRWAALVLRILDDDGTIYDQRQALGQITLPEFGASKRVSLNLQLTGGKFLGEMIPRRLVTREDFPNAAPEVIGKAVPIIFGVFSNAIVTQNADSISAAADSCSERDTIVLQETFNAGVSVAFNQGGAHWEGYSSPDPLYPTLTVTEAVTVETDGGPNPGNNAVTAATGDWGAGAVVFEGLGDYAHFGTEEGMFDATSLHVEFDMLHTEDSLDLSNFLYYPLIYLYAYAFSGANGLEFSLVSETFGNPDTATPQYYIRYTTWNNDLNDEEEVEAYVDVTYEDLLADWITYTVCAQCGTYVWDGSGFTGASTSVASDGWLKIYRGDTLIYEATDIPLLLNYGEYENAGLDASNYVQAVAFGFYGLAGKLTNITLTTGEVAETETSLPSCQNTSGESPNMASGALRALLVDTGTAPAISDPDAVEIEVGETTAVEQYQWFDDFEDNDPTSDRYNSNVLIRRASVSYDGSYACANYLHNLSPGTYASGYRDVVAYNVDNGREGAIRYRTQWSYPPDPGEQPIFSLVHGFYGGGLRLQRDAAATGLELVELDGGTVIGSVANVITLSDTAFHDIELRMELVSVNGQSDGRAEVLLDNTVVISVENSALIKTAAPVSTWNRFSFWLHGYMDDLHVRNTYEPTYVYTISGLGQVEASAFNMDALGTIHQTVFFYAAARVGNAIGPLSNAMNLDATVPKAVAVAFDAVDGADDYVVWMFTDPNFHPVTNPNVGIARTKTISEANGSQFGDYDFQVSFNSLSDGSAWEGTTEPPSTSTPGSPTGYRYLLAGHTLQMVEQVYVLKPMPTVVDGADQNILTADAASGATQAQVAFEGGDTDVPRFTTGNVIMFAGDTQAYEVTDSNEGLLTLDPALTMAHTSGTAVYKTQQVDTQVLQVEGEDYEQEVIEVNGNRYHTIVFYEALQNPDTCAQYEVTVNVRGSEINADGTGDLIDDGVSVFQHMCKNWIFNDYRSSVGEFAPSGGKWFEDVPYAPGLIDNDSFYAANLASSGRVDGNYKGAGALTEQIPASQLIKELCESFGLDFYYQNGSWSVRLFEPGDVVRADLPLYTPDTTILRDTFTVSFDDTKHANIVPYFAGPMTGRALGISTDQTGGYVVSGEVRDPASIEDYGQRIAAPLYMKWTRHAPTAYDVAFRHLLLSRQPPVFARCTAPLSVLQDALASEVRVTHPDGLGASGWSQRVCRIMRADINMDEMTVDLLLRDVDDLVP